MVLFGVAVIAIHTAAIFYNAMLADVSTEDTRGTIAGLGVGVGYLGAIIAVIIGLLFVESRGTDFGFRAIGVLSLLVSLPLFLLLKERHGGRGRCVARRNGGQRRQAAQGYLGRDASVPGFWCGS